MNQDEQREVYETPELIVYGKVEIVTEQFSGPVTHREPLGAVTISFPVPRARIDDPEQPPVGHYRRLSHSRHSHPL